MGNDITQHRARIGSFNNVISRIQTFKIRPTVNSLTYKLSPSNYKISYIKAVIMIPIIISVLAAINQSDKYLYKEYCPQPQNYLPGNVSTDITTSFILPYTFNVLAASSFSIPLDTCMETKEIKVSKYVIGIRVDHI